MRQILKKRYERRVWDAKKRSRPEISNRPVDWEACGYAKTFDLSVKSFNDTCPRIDGRVITYEEFLSSYERPNLPVVILNDQNNWSATRKWTLKHLAKRFRNQKFRCGEDDAGRKVLLKMKYFVEYMKNNVDDSPLYIFDGSFGEHRKLKKLLSDYTVSKFFPEDLFGISKLSGRPPHRWFVMGPARSGTAMHIDPLGTSAWNALIRGYKRWVLFPPQTPKTMVQPRPGEGGNSKHEAITWFTYVYPRTQRSDWPSDYRGIEILQGPGETVFVPYGWWHVVINITNTIAVTQNFCSSVNFPTVWYKTARGRPKFSKRWLRALRASRPDLAMIADSIDLSKSKSAFFVSSSSCSSSSSSSNANGSGSNQGGDSGLERRKKRQLEFW